MDNKQKLHTFSIKVQNQPGVLGRISLVFSRRAFNIESLVVSSSYKDPRFSTMTVTALGEENELEQIIKQVKKLVNVISATDYINNQETGAEIIEKELALIKLIFKSEDLTHILQIVEHFKGETLDMIEDSIIIQITGNTEKINTCIGMLKQFHIVEVVRSGKILIRRGKETT